MSNWTLLNKHRVTPAQDSLYGSDPSDGFNGFFPLMINGLKVKCIASDGEGWKHVSVSIQSNVGALPSWSIMCQVKDLFWEPEDCVVQYHPAQSEYVNLHPGVLHLWQPTKEKLPIPDRLMVGPKDEGDMQRIEKDEKIPLLQRLITRRVFDTKKPA